MLRAFVGSWPQFLVVLLAAFFVFDTTPELELHAIEWLVLVVAFVYWITTIRADLSQPK